MLQAMFGWVGSHTTGLFADETEFIDDADSSGERSIEDKYARQSGETQAGALHVQHADSQLDAKHLCGTEHLLLEGLWKQKVFQ